MTSYRNFQPWLIKKHDVICVENLQINNMLRSNRGTVANPGRNVKQKAGLNCAIANEAWGDFLRMLKLKGRVLIRMKSRNTCCTCHECDHVTPENRLSQAVFWCVKCGHKANADVNAALNILRAGLARMACESNLFGGRKQESTEALA